jgi:protein-S-isoprenylcysteine O-methyltransferase Ste14
MRLMLSGIILTIAAVGQIVAAIVLHDPDGNELLANAGWGVLMLSAVFGWLPIFTLRARGRVAGRGYMGTTALVDNGVYGIVRHPQYLAGVLMAAALVMISPHWLVGLLGLAAAACCVQSTFDEEKRCIDKFGQAYVEYMAGVPRLNFVRGIVRSVSRGRRSAA